MPENKNQISAQEWSERMRSGGRRSGSAPSINRNPVSASGALAQMRNSLTDLNKQRLALSLGNIRTQYDLAERMANLTQNTKAQEIARKERLYADRQANMNRMAQLYGQYYQQFGNMLNKEALDFLDHHSNISVPTLTAIMAGYEHARASRAQQRLTMLDRTAKMAEAEAALTEKQVALENERAANDQYANLQRLEAQSKAAQATYDAQKAFLDEQAKNEMIGAGLVGGGRGGTGVRALPGVGGAGGAARVGAANPANPEDRMRVPAPGNAAPIGRVGEDENGNPVAFDRDGNVIGPVVRDGNGQPVVINGNGQVAGSVDADGNVTDIASDPAMSAYAQYQAAGGGGFWSNPVDSALGVITSPAALPVVGAYAGALGENARLGYVSPEVRTRYNNLSDLNRIARDARRELSRSRDVLRMTAELDPRFANFQGPNRIENYVNVQRGLTNPQAQAVINEYNNVQRAAQNLRGARVARDVYITGEGGIDAIRAARNAVTTADNAGTIARRTGTALRGFGGVTGGNWLRRGFTRVAPRLATRLGMTATGIGAPVAVGLTALDALNYGPYLLGAAGGAIVQGASNFADYVSGNYDRRVREAIAAGQPIPQRPSIWQTAGEYANEASAWFWNQLDANMIPGRLIENFGMANREDVNNFSRFFKDITKTDPDYHTRRTFDKLSDVSRATILNGMLTNRDLNAQNLQAFIDDTIRTTSSPEEQQAIQQQIQAENAQDVHVRSLGTTGDSRPIQAVTEEMVKHFRDVLKTDVNYEDVALTANEYLDVVSAAESRNRSGATGANTSKGRAESLYQIMPGTLQEWKMSFLKDLGHTLSNEQKELLVNAKSANDLDNDLGRPILGAMVLRNIYKNVAVRNQKFDKRGTNIRSDQMFLDLVKMKKLAMENGQEGIDPVRYGDYLTTWAVSHVRGTNAEAVRQGLLNGNTLMDEKFGPRRNAQGGNDAWWNADFNGFDRYANMFGVPVAQAQAQQAPQYKFTYDEGVDIAGVNRLLLQRASSANEEFLEATGQSLHFTSAKRKPEKQEELWKNRETNPNKVVARRGNSPHEAGMALDFSYNRALPLFNASETLKKKYGTMDKFFAAHGLDQGIIKNGERTDLVHLAMTKDQEYFDTIDHDRYIKARGSWGAEDGNYWMRGVGERPQQVQPAWDVTPQFMVENFGYPQVQPMFYGEGEPFYDEMEENMAYLDDPNMYYDAGYVVDQDEFGNPIFQQGE